MDSATRTKQECAYPVGAYAKLLLEKTYQDSCFSIDAWVPLDAIYVHLSSRSSALKQSQSEIFWECRDSNPGLLDEKLKCYLCAMLTQETAYIFLLFFTAVSGVNFQDLWRLPF